MIQLLGGRLLPAHNAGKNSAQGMITASFAYGVRFKVRAVMAAVQAES